MACERCEECRLNGDRFCRYCGAPIPNIPAECTRCKECRQRGMRYCMGCGRPLFEEESTFMKVSTVLGLIVTLALSLLLLFEIAVMIWGIPNVLDFLTDYKSSLIMIIPMIVDIAELSGIPLKVYYIFLVIAIIACAVCLFGKAYKPTLALLKNDTEPIRKTALFEVCVLFGALYFIEMIIVLIANPSDGVSFDNKWESMFQLLEAPVWEEIITRVLFIGVPVMIITLVMKNKDFPIWHYVIGGWNRFDVPTLIFILFSAIMFGLGHVFGSWGVWKFFPTFLFGIIAGYLFVKYGVYATIMMHFLTDYMTAETYLFDTELPVFSALIVTVTMLMCIPYVWIYTKRGFVFLKDKFRKKESEQLP